MRGDDRHPLLSSALLSFHPTKTSVALDRSGPRAHLNGGKHDAERIVRWRFTVRAHASRNRSVYAYEARAELNRLGVDLSKGKGNFGDLKLSANAYGFRCQALRSDIRKHTVVPDEVYNTNTPYPESTVSPTSAGTRQKTTMASACQHGQKAKRGVEGVEVSPRTGFGSPTPGRIGVITPWI